MHVTVRQGWRGVRRTPGGSPHLGCWAHRGRRVPPRWLSAPASPREWPLPCGATTTHWGWEFNSLVAWGRLAGGPQHWRLINFYPLWSGQGKLLGQLGVDGWACLTGSGSYPHWESEVGGEINELRLAEERHQAWLACESKRASLKASKFR